MSAVSTATPKAIPLTDLTQLLRDACEESAIITTELNGDELEADASLPENFSHVAKLQPGQDAPAVLVLGDIPTTTTHERRDDILRARAWLWNLEATLVKTEIEPGTGCVLATYCVEEN